MTEPENDTVERPDAADAGSTPLKLSYSAISDVGRVRKDNQDSGFASDHLLVVADGVGGAARGDIASSTAVQILRRLDGPAFQRALLDVVAAVGEHSLHQRGEGVRIGDSQPGVGVEEGEVVDGVPDVPADRGGRSTPGGGLQRRHSGVQDASAFTSGLPNVLTTRLCSSALVGTIASVGGINLPMRSSYSAPVPMWKSASRGPAISSWKNAPRLSASGTFLSS